MQPEQFKRIASHWLTGVSVVTALAPASSSTTGTTKAPASASKVPEPQGMTVSAVTSLSLDPPQFLICIDRRAKTLDAILSSGHFCINVLADHQEDVSNTFARRGTTNRFAGIPYKPGRTGAPIIDNCLAHVECRVAAVIPGGDHSIVIGDALYSDTRQGQPLAYFNGSYRRVSS